MFYFDCSDSFSCIRDIFSPAGNLFLLSKSKDLDYARIITLRQLKDNVLRARLSEQNLILFLIQVARIIGNDDPAAIVDRVSADAVDLPDFF